MGAPLRLRSKTNDAAGQWSAPVGWIPTRPGVWIPAEYKQTRWEIETPAVHNDREAEADWIRCAKSLSYFAFRHCWTLDVDDPSGAPSVRKFPAYPYLRRFFDSVQTPKNVHVDKSRQMLLSWAWMIVLVWDVTFHRNWKALVLSKTAPAVDDGGENSDPAVSNFGKFRFVQQHLAEHLWVPVQYKKFSIRVPATNSMIKGETSKGGKAARAGTFNRGLMDEAAYIEHSETVFTGLRQSAKTGTCLNSTPNGMGNTFSRIKFSTTTTFLRLSFHWSEHPRKAIGLYCLCGWKAIAGTGQTPREQFEAHRDVCARLRMDPPRSPEMRSPWYDRESGDMTPEKVASDLDISYQASRRGRCYTAFDQVRNVWQIYHKLGPRRIEETPDDYTARYLRMAINPRLQCFTAKDIGVGDPTAVLFGQIVDDRVPRIRILDELESSDESYEFYGNYINTVWKVAAASVGNPLTFLHYGGQDVKSRWGNLESWFSNLKGMGIHVQTQFQGEQLEWIDYINDQYRNGFLEISEWCKGTIDATNNYHFPVDDNGEPIPGVHLPVHDEWSHKMDALRYLYRVRYAARLKDRRAKGVKSTKILRRGKSYDARTETRRF